MVVDDLTIIWLMIERSEVLLLKVEHNVLYDWRYYCWKLNKTLLANVGADFDD